MEHHILISSEALKTDMTKARSSGTKLFLDGDHMLKYVARQEFLE
jgi:hypothetical protein